MEILRWHIDPLLKKEIDEHYRTRYAISLKGEPVIDIVKKLTFDSVAPHITIPDVERFVQFVDTKFLGKRLRGVGVEMGGGCGFFGAIFAKNPDIEKIYSVEVCENVVRELATKVVEDIAGHASRKVVGVVGEFDRIELPDASVDFVFDFFSFHHSENLEKTFREAHRILKPGGFVLCFDKARANSLSADELEKLLDREYSREAKILMGIPPEKYHTRRMNGEKEYRLKDWKEAFLKAGFSTFEHFHIARLIKGNPVIFAGKKLLSSLPPRLAAKLSWAFSFHKGNKNNIEESHKVYTPLVHNFPKEISLMIAWKDSQLS